MTTHLDKYLNQQQQELDRKPRTLSSYFPNSQENIHHQMAPATASTSPLIRSVLLSKLTFNLSKGHYGFVAELLKNKLENKQKVSFEINVNEMASNEQIWLQLESNQMNRKFLNGKSPLILCCYIKENEWAMSLCRLLIENGALISMKDALNGCNALHYACALLKCDLIELFLKNLNSNLNYSRDFNGNTPLVYLMVSYSFYLSKFQVAVSPSTQRSTQMSAPDLKHLLIEETENNSVSQDEAHETFQLKVLNTLKIVFDYLKHFNISINTVNRFGYNLYDYYLHLTRHHKFLETNPVFSLIYSTIMEENNKNTKFDAMLKVESPLRTISTLSKANSNEYMKTSSPNQDTAKLSLNLNELNATNKANFESLLKKHLLISLSEMRNYKNIIHSKKVDKNLLLLFINKPVKKTNSIKSSLGKSIEVSRRDVSMSLQSVNLMPNVNKVEDSTFVNSKGSWREKFNQFYDSLEISHSESFRKSVKITFEKLNENQNNQNQQNHHQQNHKLNGLPPIAHKNDHTSSSHTVSSKKSHHLAKPQHGRK